MAATKKKATRKKTAKKASKKKVSRKKTAKKASKKKVSRKKTSKKKVTRKKTAKKKASRKGKSSSKAVTYRQSTIVEKSTTSARAAKKKRRKKKASRKASSNPARTPRTKAKKARSNTFKFGAYKNKQPPGPVGGYASDFDLGQGLGISMKDAPNSSTRGKRKWVGKQGRAVARNREHAGKVVTFREIRDEVKGAGLKAWVCAGPVRSGCGGGSKTLAGGRQVGRL